MSICLWLQCEPRCSQEPIPSTGIVGARVEMVSPGTERVALRKTTIVPKNCHVPIKQHCRNIFDKGVCQLINWDMVSPDDGCEMASQALGGDSSGQGRLDGGARSQPGAEQIEEAERALFGDEDDEWVKQALADARTASCCVLCICCG